ncbi:3-keto-disaccharide hydrolase [Portibacter lacus]|uniref:Glycosyl hydrolase n=1 Tax=Portibacter lacus TaxID=1099794 RepID=A0AA37SQJ2_9BACT|nr:DUF1080 domain-containing protein [Portibacter lacus]GLR16788.1 glycosyl hydrolase [Portibacter lacus]
MQFKFLIVAIITICTFSLSAQNADEGFVSLFNGTSLDGWTATEENASSFLVEDGKLVARGGKAHLFYTGSVGDANFKDFELKMRIMTNEKSNSGVYFQTAYQKSGWPAKGFEAQVNSRHSDPRKTGSLYNIVNMWAPEAVVEPFLVKVDEKGEIFMLRESAPSTDGEWFDYYIKVVGNRIVIKVNGVITVDWTQPKDWEMGGRRIGEGTVGIQAHDPTCEVYYKDIQIKILD